MLQSAVHPNYFSRRSVAHDNRTLIRFSSSNNEICWCNGLYVFQHWNCFVKTLSLVQHLLYNILRTLLWTAISQYKHRNLLGPFKSNITSLMNMISGQDFSKKPIKFCHQWPVFLSSNDIVKLFGLEAVMKATEVKKVEAV